MENEGKAGRFSILPMLKNMENEGKPGRVQFLQMFKKMWKMKVKEEYF